MRKPDLPALGRGTYVLVLRLSRPALLRVGGLGRQALRGGYYLYAGSALGPGGLTARLRHHLGLALRPHWHVDYLRRRAVLEEVWYSEQGRRREHEWAALLRHLPGTAVPVAGFGASDCACQAHLVHTETQPLLSAFQGLVERHCPRDAAVRGLRVRAAGRPARGAPRR